MPVTTTQNFNETPKQCNAISIPMLVIKRRSPPPVSHRTLPHSKQSCRLDRKVSMSVSNEFVGRNNSLARLILPHILQIIKTLIPLQNLNIRSKFRHPLHHPDN